MNNKKMLLPLIAVVLIATGIFGTSYTNLASENQQLKTTIEKVDNTLADSPVPINYAIAKYEGSAGIITAETHNNMTSLGLNRSRDADIGIQKPGMLTVIASSNNDSYIELSSNAGAPSGDWITLPNPITGNGLSITYPDSFVVTNQSRMGNWSMTKKFTYTGSTLVNVCTFGITNTTASGDNYIHAVFNFSTCFPMQQSGDNLTITYGRTYCANTACV